LKNYIVNKAHSRHYSNLLDLTSIINYINAMGYMHCDVCIKCANKYVKRTTNYIWKVMRSRNFDAKSLETLNRDKQSACTCTHIQTQATTHAYNFV